jgi:hypothetical protein
MLFEYVLVKNFRASQRERISLRLPSVTLSMDGVTLAPSAPVVVPANTTCSVGVQLLRLNINVISKAAPASKQASIG